MNCKIAIEEPQECGKTVCCHYCEDKMDCINACAIPQPCPEQVEETSALQIMEDAVPDKIREVTDLMIQMKKAEDRITKIKESLLKAMEENGIKKFENEQISFTYVAPSIRKTFDKKALQKDYPDIDLDQYQKGSKVKASVRIQVK